VSDARGRFHEVLNGVRQFGLTAEVASLEPLLHQVPDPTLQGEIARLLGFYWLRQGDLDRAIGFSDLAADRLPHDHSSAYNAIFARFRRGAWDDAAERAKQALDRRGEHFEFCNLLSAALGALGHLTEARRFGTRALELKERQATAPARDLSTVAVPAFDAATPARNVIAFSLFGAQTKYTQGALLNVRVAQFLYPGWCCRFYVDGSVPSDTTQALLAEGAQVMTVGGMPNQPFGTFWRFLVADDPSVDRFVLRDADSLVNTRERVAVDDWIASGRHFHVMRDHFDHSELVLAGMWGGVRGALPPMLPAIRAWYAARQRVIGATADQAFLREALWPTIRQSVLTHDSQFAFGERRDFPALGSLPPDCWVGCDWGRMVPPKPGPSPVA